MLLQMYHFFFGCFQKQPKSKCIFLRPPQILNFNSWIHITDTKAKTDLRCLQATKQLGLRNMWRAGADAPWRLGPACARRLHRPCRPATETLCLITEPPPPSRLHPSPPSTISHSPIWLPSGGRSSNIGQLGNEQHLACSEREPSRAGLRKVWTRKYIDRLHLRGNKRALNKDWWKKDAGSCFRTATCCETGHFPSLPRSSP